MASVKVLINSKTNIILFKHMNESIVIGYKRKGILPSMAEHKVTFEDIHGVKIEFGDSTFWQYMEFPDEQAYTMAMLKWL